MADITKVLGTLVDRVSRLELQNQLQAVLMRVNREFRADNARLKLQNEAGDAPRKLYKTITSLPTVTSQVQPSPSTVDVNSEDESESNSPPKQRTCGDNLRSKNLIKPPNRFQ